MDKRKYKLYLRKVNENPFPNIKKILINESNSFYPKPPEEYSDHYSRNTSSNVLLTKQSSEKKLNDNYHSNTPKKENIFCSNSHQYKPGLPLIRQHLIPFSKPHVPSNYLSKSVEKKIKNDEYHEDYSLMKQKYEVFKNQLCLVKAELKLMNTIIIGKEKEIKLLTDSYLREKEINISNISYMGNQQDLISHQQEKIKALQKELNETKGIITKMMEKKLNKMPIPSLLSNEQMKATDFLIRIVLYNHNIILNENIDIIEDYVGLLSNYIHPQDYYLFVSYFTTVSKDKDNIRKDYLINYFKSLNEEKMKISEDNLQPKEKDFIINQCKLIDSNNKGIVDYHDYKMLLSTQLSQIRFNRSIYEMKQRYAHPLFHLYYTIFDTKIEEEIEDKAKRITNELFETVINKYNANIENSDKTNIENAFFITEKFVDQVFSSSLNYFNSNQMIYL